MSNITKSDKPKTAVQFFEQPAVRTKFEAMLGKRAPQFITSVLQIVNSNSMLKNADPVSVYTAAATAATLDLPINNNLGFAYIVPFNDRKSGTTQAQFQIGWRGFIQLAQRSGQFRTISATPVYDGQIDYDDPLKGIKFNWGARKSDTIIGYAAFFELLNGFEKTLYMTKSDIERHAGKYSQTFKKGYGVWKDDFDAMAQKTVLKMLLSKYAPLSVEMQTATVADQAVVKNADELEVQYVDNDVDPVYERAVSVIESCETVAELDSLNLGDEYTDLINAKREALNASK
jgi:recombination protein RecT